MVVANRDGFCYDISGQVWLTYHEPTSSMESG
jgi:hypothetical protein